MYDNSLLTNGLHKIVQHDLSTNGIVFKTAGLGMLGKLTLQVIWTPTQFTAFLQIDTRGKTEIVPSLYFGKFRILSTNLSIRWALVKEI